MNYKDRIILSVPIFSKMLKKQKLVNQTLVTGGVAGALSVPGLKKGDELVGVVALTGTGQALIAGAVAGDLVVTGITTNDELIGVIDITTPGDMTSEFSITAANTINNTGGTSTAATNLIVTWKKGNLDLTDEFEITDDAVINNASGTITTGMKLLATWVQWEDR